METTQQDIRLDPRPLFAVAAHLATVTIDGVTDAQLVRPTPCPDFDVAHLLDHLALVASRIASLGRGAADYSIQDGGTTGWPAGRIAETWKAAMADAEAAWADPESLSRTVTLPWATMPGAGVLSMYLSEVTVHTWDLARATGQQPAWDPAVVETSLAFMEQALPADIRGGADDAEVPFAPVVATAADAPALDRLVAWCGRNPSWA